MRRWSRKPLLFQWLINFWPPFFAAGIRVTKIEGDYDAIHVQLKEHFYNRNYVGTHFGGSLFAMTDPFFMLMLIKKLGPGYVVWDQESRIRFKKPGRGTVQATFTITPDTLETIRSSLGASGPIRHPFSVMIRNQQGEVVAEVEKTLYIRRKDPS
jgi:acyl-coenzyme A thioesterase PaaI-like protein